MAKSVWVVCVCDHVSMILYDDVVFGQDSIQLMHGEQYNTLLSSLNLPPRRFSPLPPPKIRPSLSWPARPIRELRRLGA